MALPSWLAKVTGWLGLVKPGSAPWHGDIPLLALRGRQLTDDDVTLIADELAFSADPTSDLEIRKAIRAITGMSVNDPDVARVRLRLAEKGWPSTTAGPD